MNARRVWVLAKKDLRKVVREPASLFLVVLFPLMLTLAFGVSFGAVGGGGQTKYEVGVVDLNAPGLNHHWSDDFVANLSRNAILHVGEMDNASAQAALAQGDLQAVVVIPEGFGASCASFVTNPADSTSWVNATVLLYLDRGSMVATQAVPPIVFQTLAQTLSGGRALASSLPVSVGSPALVAADARTTFDFMAPGLFAYAAIFLTMTVGQSLTVEREEGLLRRLRTTPLTPGEFMASQVLSNMVLAVLQVGLVFLGAYLLGYRPATGADGLALAFVLALVFSLCNVGFGLITATLAKSPGAATGLAFLFIMPQMFLGTFIAGSALASDLGRFVPSHYITDALTQLFLRGAPVTSAPVLGDLAILAAVSVGAFAVSVALFRRYGRD